MLISTNDSLGWPRNFLATAAARSLGRLIYRLWSVLLVDIDYHSLMSLSDVNLITKIVLTSAATWRLPLSSSWLTTVVDRRLCRHRILSLFFSSLMPVNHLFCRSFHGSFFAPLLRCVRNCQIYYYNLLLLLLLTIKSHILNVVSHLSLLSVFTFYCFKFLRTLG